MIDFTLYLSAMRDLVRLRRLFWVIVLVLIAPGFALLFRESPGSGFKPLNAYTSMAEVVVFGFVIVILSVLFATGAITQELEQKTIVYLLTRPVARWRILLAKYVAAVSLTTMAAWISLSLLAMVTVEIHGLSHAHFWLQMWVVPFAVMAYSGLFLFIATVTGRTLVPLGIGILYGFLWETAVPQFPGNFKVISLMTYVHLIGRLPTDNTGGGGIFGLASSPGYHITIMVGWAVLLLTFAIFTLASLIVFSLKEYVPKEETA